MCDLKQSKGLKLDLWKYIPSPIPSYEAEEMGPRDSGDMSRTPYLVSNELG